MYVGFAAYLYQPYFKHFDTLQHLLVVNVCLASLGCFVLSRRWVSAFWGSFFAGAIYGFGPFMLSLANFHPTAGLLAAIVPWLFCPAALYAKSNRWIGVLLSALPFLAILLFFQVSIPYRLFAVWKQARLHLGNLLGLIAPFYLAQRNITATLVGVYHIPIAALLMGFSMLLAARRLGIITIFALGIVLACCWSFLNVSPVMWLAIPVLCCSILVGAGMQGFASSGFADRRWVLAAAVIMGILAIVTLLLAIKCYQIFAGLGRGYAELFMASAWMYIFGAIAVAIIFFMTRAKLRIAPLRWVILSSAMAVDIFLGARFIVDRIL
ncbi:MAG: hypothetical protein AMJ75_02080 [Phycisphaerae bacterium SM1_79]|nr:MAG: hypothetical protein AMJ75_02080 [Phycisphaerae bacterium SM1_79]